MVKHFTSSHHSRNSIFADRGVPDDRRMPTICRTAAEAKGSLAYTHSEPKHDPCPKFVSAKLCADIRNTCNAKLAASAEMWVAVNEAIFIRQPFIESPEPWFLALKWMYDGEVLRLRFVGDAIIHSRQPVTRARAAELVVEWNARVIRGEMARIRAAGLPQPVGETADLDLIDGDDGW